MKIGVSTLFGLHQDPVDVCRRLYDCGIDTVELMLEHRHNKISYKDVGKIKDIRIDYSAHMPFSGLCFVHPDPYVREPAINLVKRCLDIAEGVGAKECVMHGGIIPADYMHIDNAWTKEDFYSLFVDEFCPTFLEKTKKGMKILLENLSDNNLLCGNARDVLSIRKQLPYLDFCFDFPHGEKLGETNFYMGNYMWPVHVHISDSERGADGHLRIGDGDLEIAEFLGKLKSRDYRGKIIFEGKKFDDATYSFQKLSEMIK